MTKNRRRFDARTAFLALLVVSSLLLLSACAQLERLGSQPEASEVAETPPPEPSPPPEPPPPKRNTLYQWYGDGRSVSHIEIDVDAQKAVFYDGPHQIGWTRVASGVRSNPTPTGNFSITEKIADKRSNLYGKILNSKGKVVRKNAEMGVHRIPAGGRFQGAKMPFFMRLTNDGIGMHAGPIPRPGRPASHGCIRMPHALAPVLYRHVSIGTPVSIVGSGPSYGKYLASQRRKKPEGAPAPKTGGTTNSQVATASPVSGAAPEEAIASTTDAAPTTARTTAVQPENTAAMQIASEGGPSSPPTATPVPEPSSASTDGSRSDAAVVQTTAEVAATVVSEETTLPDATANVATTEQQQPAAAASSPKPASQPLAQPATAKSPGSSETAATSTTGAVGTPAPAPARVLPPSPEVESVPTSSPASATGSASPEASADAAHTSEKQEEG